MTDIALKKIEREIVKKLTDELVKLAKYPVLKRTFNFATSHDYYYTFYKDKPKMSNIEYVALALCHIDRLAHTEQGEDVPSLMDRIEELLASINDAFDYSRVAVAYYLIMFIYLHELNDMEQAFEYYRKWFAALVSTPEGAREEDLINYIALVQRGKEWQFVDLIKDCDAYMVEQTQIVKETGDYDDYVNSIARYWYSKISLLDKEETCVLKAFLQISGIIHQPKCKKNKKGSFDYNYARAEKGKKEYQLLVAKAYREGDGVPRNLRLANVWEKLANSKTPE